MVYGLSLDNLRVSQRYASYDRFLSRIVMEFTRTSGSYRISQRKEFICVYAYRPIAFFFRYVKHLFGGNEH